jgi:hypothetical protein
MVYIVFLKFPEKSGLLLTVTPKLLHFNGLYCVSSYRARVVFEKEKGDVLVLPVVFPFVVYYCGAFGVNACCP